MEYKNQFESGAENTAITCAEFDVLLNDALDGTLAISSKRRFDFHKQQCPTCGPLFAETSAGLNWLGTLEEIEPPANLIHNILTATSAHTKEALAFAPKMGWKQRLSELLTDLVAPVRVLVRQPRLAMTGAMAVFSVSLTLNLVGVKLSDVRHIDLRPSAIRQQATMKYYETSSRVVKYYENIRLVYEVESRLQELKRATGSDEQEQPRPSERKKTEKNDRDRKQNYYSMERQHSVLAQWSTNELNLGMNQNQRFIASKEAKGINPEDLTQVLLSSSSGLEQSDKSIRSLFA